LIVVGYRADVIQDFFRDGSRFGFGISYETQMVQDGTGKVMELARAFVGTDAFILSYGDILIDPLNYRRLVRLDADTEAIVSVKRDEDVSKGGAVFVNTDFELIDLRERPKPGEPMSLWYNAGVYAFRPSIFEYIARLQRSPRGEFELTDAIGDLARTDKKVRALELTGDWADVRDPEIQPNLNR